MSFIPNKEQANGLKIAVKWFKNQDKQCLEISGGAGTGKTTLVYHLIQELGIDMCDVAFVAFVGKAALALTRKGTPATTIHNLIYDLQERPKVDKDGNIVKDPLHDKILYDVRFVKKERLPKNIRLIVIDEGAMVSENIAKDILSYDIPIIVLGDRNQLPPVIGNPVFLEHPDIVLTEPMRQALESPIIYLAQLAMRGERIKYGRYGDSCFVIRKDSLTDKMLVKSDALICHRNATRDSLNRHIREDILNIHKEHPIKGDKMICRQNNWNQHISDNIYLINGLVGYVENVNLESYDKRSIEINFRPEFMIDDMFTDIKIDYKYLVAPYKEKIHMGRCFYNKFEYAYAITCHLSQGSQYENVLVYNEYIPDSEFYNKWLYTAITRASDSLIIAL